MIRRRAAPGERRRAAPRVAAVVLLLWACETAAAAPCAQWPAWAQFKSDFISADGRVIDPHTDPRHTVSEGQAYALFFALAADDRETFARLLQWTENNLAAGDLSARLPAWQWGRTADGAWGVIDDNSAADADLWLAYTLAEAGRLWDLPRYRTQAVALGQLILREEVADLPGLGPTLLPGRQGFEISARRWRLNPSYAPVVLLRGLQTLQPDLDWHRLLPGTDKLLRESTPSGFAADWVVYDAVLGFMADTETAGIGSYNAIRVYLWTGLMSNQDPLRAALLKTFRPMAERVRADGIPPERVNTLNGRGEGESPPGFSAALLPFLNALGLGDTLRALDKRLKQNPPAAGAYYDQVLSLFGRGGLEHRFRFRRDGRLYRSPTSPCVFTPSSSPSP